MSTRNPIRSAGMLLIALASAAVFSGGRASAALIAPGSSGVTTPGAFTFAGLTVIADESFTATAFDTTPSPRYTATVESQVLVDPAGTLDFAYQVTNSPLSLDAIEGLSVTKFNSFVTDVDYVTVSGGDPYATVGRPAVLSGITVSFQYTSGDAILPGVSADWVIIKTNALKYNSLGSAALIDGAPVNVAAFEPTVPEPASLALLGSGGLALLAGRRNRRRPV